MTRKDAQRSTSVESSEDIARVVSMGRWARLRSRLRHGVSLRMKLILPVLAIACLAVSALFAFAYVSLRTSIASIYEARARSVAAVISKSIQEKDYILYYSDELDTDIARLLEQYDTILGITVIGATARGFVTVASTDPTRVGAAATSGESAVYESLREVEVERTDAGALRAMHPVGTGAERAGVVIVDMSPDEEAGYERRLILSFGMAAGFGVLFLCGLLGLVLTSVVTRPVRRLAAATTAVAERRYPAASDATSDRVPGVPVRDEICQLADGFELMAARIQTHEQELRKLVVLDELTGLYNASHFRDQLAIEVGKGKRYGHPTSLVVVDLDGLADQDLAEQDRARVRTASFLIANLRRVDTVYRVARDRFVGVLPETPASGAMVAAERVRAFSADVVTAFPFPLFLSVSALGWGAGDDVAVADVVRRLSGEGEGSPG